ncbi:MAG TPA: hypothetical protein VHJ17_09985, partial [Thermomonospora sp.]|nr:hypothetical protein [Thermomonospora sp.]
RVIQASTRDRPTRFAGLARRVGRSRVLAWMTRGLGVVDEETIARHGLTGPVARHPGDVTARLRGWLRETEMSLALLDDASPLREAGAVGRASGARTADLLSALLPGTELAAARLVVASLDPDLDQRAVEAADA